MAGIDNRNGRSIGALEHVRQSVRDIITTPIGSRVMRREYGSLVPDLIDMPQSDAVLMQVYAATVIAVTRWEPRIRITSVRRQIAQSGGVILEISGQTRGGPAILEVAIT